LRIGYLCVGKKKKKKKEEEGETQEMVKKIITIPRVEDGREEI
jgi:hypothetical protein